MPFINQIERSPLDVFCQSIRIAGAVGAAESALLAERASGWLALIAPAGKLALIPPTTGECKLIGPAAGTPTVGALEGERGAVEGESSQETTPATEAIAKKTAE